MVQGGGRLLGMNFVFPFSFFLKTSFYMYLMQSGMGRGRLQGGITYM